VATGTTTLRRDHDPRLSFRPIIGDLYGGTLTIAYARQTACIARSQLAFKQTDVARTEEFLASLDHIAASWCGSHSAASIVRTSASTANTVMIPTLLS
jgi:hypothetical protein